MNKNAIDLKLDTLFAEWRTRMEGDGYQYFTKDGILYKNELSKQDTLALWGESQKRVVFLLKDQNQSGKARWDEDIRYWLVGDGINNKRNRELCTPFIKNLGYMLWGLCKVNNECDWWYNEVTKHLDEVKKFFNTQPFGLIECKKAPGGPICYDSDLKPHLDKYSDLLKREIEILNPNIIVCTNHHIYAKVRTFYLEDELEEYVAEGDGKVSYHPASGTIIALGTHPASRKNKESIYEDLMWPYRNFLRNRNLF